MTYAEALLVAERESRKGYVQHVNRIGADRYAVSDWFDGTLTVASFERGRRL